MHQQPCYSETDRLLCEGPASVQGVKRFTLIYAEFSNARVSLSQPSKAALCLSAIASACERAASIASEREANLLLDHSGVNELAPRTFACQCPSKLIEISIVKPPTGLVVLRSRCIALIRLS